MNADGREAALALLRWYVEMGADEAIGCEAADRLAPPPASMPPPAAIRQHRSVGNPPAPFRPPRLLR